MEACPQPERLAEGVEGELPGPEREALERHAAECGDCRALLSDLAATTESPALLPRTRMEPWTALGSGTRGFPWLRVAAAGLVLAAGAWALRPKGGAPPASVVPAGLPEGTHAAASAARALVAPGSDLLLAPGSEVRVREGGLLLAERGTCWVSASGPETLRIGVAEALVTLKSGRVAVEAQRAPGASAWIASAFAGTPARARVTVLEGEAALGGETGRTGVRWILGEGAFRREAATEQELSALRRASAEAAAGAPGDPVFPPGARLTGHRTVGAGLGPPPAWRWATRIAQRGSATEVGLTFPVPEAGGRPAWREWVVGLAAARQEGREIVEVLWDGKVLTGRVDGETRFSGEPARLERLLRSQAAEGWAVSIWDGEVLLDRSVLQAGLPAGQ